MKNYCYDRANDEYNLPKKTVFAGFWSGAEKAWQSRKTVITNECEVI